MAVIKPWNNFCVYYMCKFWAKSNEEMDKHWEEIHKIRK